MTLGQSCSIITIQNLFLRVNSSVFHGQNQLHTYKQGFFPYQSATSRVIITLYVKKLKIYMNLQPSQI